MADHFYGVNRGSITNSPKSNITIGTLTGSTDIEVRVADGQHLTRADIYKALEVIRDRIVADPTIFTTVVGDAS